MKHFYGFFWYFPPLETFRFLTGNLQLLFRPFLSGSAFSWGSLILESLLGMSPFWFSRQPLFMNLLGQWENAYILTGSSTGCIGLSQYSLVSKLYSTTSASYRGVLRSTATPESSEHRYGLSWERKCWLRVRREWSSTPETLSVNWYYLPIFYNSSWIHTFLKKNTVWRWVLSQSGFTFSKTILNRSVIYCSLHLEPIRRKIHR